MDRKIKFRGQSITGEWLYGSLIVFGERMFIYPENGSHEDYHFYGYEVIPETVGQFTAIAGKDGNYIYEGDKYQVAGNKIYEVRWLDKGVSHFELYAACFILWLDEEIFFPFDEFAINNGRVIGNIHDNPELINPAQ